MAPAPVLGVAGSASWRHYRLASEPAWAIPKVISRLGTLRFVDEANGKGEGEEVGERGKEEVGHAAKIGPGRSCTRCSQSRSLLPLTSLPHKLLDHSVVFSPLLHLLSFPLISSSLLSSPLLPSPPLSSGDGLESPSPNRLAVK